MQNLHCLWNPGKLLEISTAFGEAQNRKAGQEPLHLHGYQSLIRGMTKIRKVKSVTKIMDEEKENCRGQK